MPSGGRTYSDVYRGAISPGFLKNGTRLAVWSLMALKEIPHFLAHEPLDAGMSTWREDPEEDTRTSRWLYKISASPALSSYLRTLQ